MHKIKSFQPFFQSKEIVGIDEQPVKNRHFIKKVRQIHG